MALKSFIKLFNVVFISAWFECAGCRSLLAVALEYVLCCVVGGVECRVEVAIWIF